MRVNKAENRVKIDHVLLSVSDKSGLDVLVARLIAVNPAIRMYSTGGTYEAIASLPDTSGRLISISDYTGQPEMSGGLVKTLDFKIYLGLLSESYNDAHHADLRRTGAVTFDMVVVNLYPFSSTIAKPGIDAEDARGNIDIGGPCMLRASAKNYLRVLPVCDPGDYSRVADAIEAGNGSVDLRTRFEFARKAFRHTAEYDTAISAYLADIDPDSAAAPYTLE